MMTGAGTRISIPNQTSKEHEMAKVLVVNHVTLDGVMQAPARPDEDTRDGFVHGGWAMALLSGDAAGQVAEPGSLRSWSSSTPARRTRAS